MISSEGRIMLRQDGIISALRALGAILTERDIRFEAIVLGGANLLVSGVIQRPTVDIDVVAQRGTTGELLTASPLPAEVADAVAIVARLQGLPGDWFNSVSGSEIQFGLPAGCMDRLRSQAFGHLIVLWIDRQDMVAFKLVAAVDHLSFGANKHLDDLRLLQPSSADLDHAVAWFETITAPTSAAFLGLAEILQEFDHGR
jgi:hypothetical protein